MYDPNTMFAKGFMMIPCQNQEINLKSLAFVSLKSRGKLLKIGVKGSNAMHYPNTMFVKGFLLIPRQNQEINLNS